MIKIFKNKKIIKNDKDNSFLMKIFKREKKILEVEKDKNILVEEKEAKVDNDKDNYSTHLTDQV